MEIIEVKTKEQLQELYDAWAMTWEGLRSEDFEVALQECGKDGAKGFLTKGKVMNELCHLTGDNAYPDDLGFLVVPDLHIPELKLALGARWFDDIVSSNAIKQHAVDENTEPDFK